MITGTMKPVFTVEMPKENSLNDYLQEKVKVPYEIVDSEIHLECQGVSYKFLEGLRKHFTFTDAVFSDNKVIIKNLID